MMTDPIADMLTRIRNAQAVRKEHVDVPASKLKRAIADLLRQEQYVGDVQSVNDGRMLRILLKYDREGQPVIRHVRRLSKPGRRQYVQKDAMPTVLGGSGIAIVSTSKGVMTNKEARKSSIGGELICEVF